MNLIPVSSVIASKISNNMEFETAAVSEIVTVKFGVRVSPGIRYQVAAPYPDEME